jgi:glycerol kinase
MPLLLAIDQSTSATKVLLFDEQGGVVDKTAREHRQHYPQAGWVEHDAGEIWANLLDAAGELLTRQAVRTNEIAGVSIANQRETFVAFDRDTGGPLHPAIVWQCRRGDPFCAEQVRLGREEALRIKTGLRVDSYFSAPKIQWLVRNRPDLAARFARGTARLGTIDTYLVYRLTNGAVFATDHTNASRTMLFDLAALNWDDELCSWWQVPRAALAEIRSSGDRFGTTTLSGLLSRPVPICGVMGDSQASLFAHRCFEPGTAKVTFGSGSSVLLNVGQSIPPTGRGCVAALAWVIAGLPTYAAEGIITSSASTITWLRDQLGLISSPMEAEKMAREVDDNGGVYLVPAFSGLGAPHWAEGARAAIVGLSAHSDRRHVARAALESIGYQLRDVLDAMRRDSAVALKRLQGDGGASANAFLMQFCADLTGVELRVASSPHLSPLGAAWMGALGLGIHKSVHSILALPGLEALYLPSGSEIVSPLLDGWHRAVHQVLNGISDSRLHRHTWHS